MNQEIEARLAQWEKDIYDKYERDFFTGIDDPRYPMWYGIACDEGWSKVIAAALRILHHRFYKKGLRIFQIKEKYGTLRLYTENTDNNTIEDKDMSEVYGVINMAEAMCEITCESCGKDGTIRQKGWWKTLCDECNGDDNDS